MSRIAKLKTISRTEEDYVRKSKLDITKVHRNRDPALHPFERAREYQKALVATKLDKIFAKPFLYALDGHTDGVNCTEVIRNKMAPFISGACNGELKVWDLPSKRCVWTTNAHRGFVRGIATDVSGTKFYTCGDDKTVKLWNLSYDDPENITPIRILRSKTTLTHINHHWTDNKFATSGEAVSLWDAERADPILNYQCGTDSVICVAFNPAEECLLGSTGSDRGVCLYDVRASIPMKKFVLAMRSNKLAWNPREPFNFVLANEDFNLYSFDMRKLDTALMIHKDHVNAVLDVAFSPTGREFVSGSYDRTIRIFNVNSGRSRELYHTKRMQRVFCVNFSADSHYVFSGSDDTNIRVWKANASKPLGVQPGRKERKQQLNDALKKRYSHMPEIARISKHRNVPKPIKKANLIKHIQRQSVIRKQENRKKHSREEDSKMEPEKKRVVIKELD